MLSIILTIVGILAIVGSCLFIYAYPTTHSNRRATQVNGTNNNFNHKLARDKAAAMHAHMGNTHRIR